MRVSGALVEISGDDLRFRSWEVEELFATAYPGAAVPEAAAALTRRTGGWAAGLQLFHLATTGAGRSTERQRAVADLGGRSRLVRSYLARQRAGRAPAASGRSCCATCTLGALTGPLCDALLADPGAVGILDELEQRQLFTSSVDDGETFRYHEVLQQPSGDGGWSRSSARPGRAKWYCERPRCWSRSAGRRGTLRAPTPGPRTGGRSPGSFRGRARS